MKFFPINLNINNKLCVIVGCGKVGERKAFDLFDYNVKIRIVSLDFTENVLNYSKRFELIKSEYKKDYIKNAFLVFACTDDKSINLQIYKDAKENGALVNIANYPEFCDFTLPAVVKRGKVKIAISSEGTSPALSRIIKEKISNVIGNEYEILAHIMGKIREKQLKLNLNSNENRKKFYKFLNSDILEILKEKDYKQKINKKVKEIFGFEI